MKTENTLIGRISTNSRGVGYVSVEGKKPKERDIEIENKNLNTALNGDLVKISVVQKNGRVFGRVERVLERKKTGFSGVLEEEGGMYFLAPDDYKTYIKIAIPKEKLSGAKNGDKVFVAMADWNDSKKIPTGQVVKIFGRPGENNAEMLAIAMEKGFDSILPPKIEEEAKKIKNLGIREEDYKDRRDFRNTLTFTIDPEDAKDFDDAISFKELGNGKYEIGVHIADVSYYVKEGGAIDREAYSRGTSVYLVDRTIPMLPEILSNDLCSLVPNQDRLVLSAVFEMDQNGSISGEWFGESVIRSQKRFSYEDAQGAIENENKKLHQELSLLNNIAKIFTKQRIDKGALLIEENEVKFVLDEDGKPIRVYKKERKDAHRLIEEFMLLANKRVAELMSKNKKLIGAFVYRIHDLPNKEKMSDLAFFLKGLGYKVYLRDGIIPQAEINTILRNISGKLERDAVSRAVIRSMAKAIYSTENIGHYGLRFEHYTHFTSPIRRYPDLLVHRILKKYLKGGKFSSNLLKEYTGIARSASERERDAVEAERDSIKYKQVEYMSERVGQSFTGVISGVSEAGLYIEEKETRSEGMVRLRDLTDDFYILNEKKLEIMGERKKKRYRFGDEVKIKVSKVDLERKTIDYILI